MVDSLYEEDKDEEIQKYYIPEEMKELERITLICKRGAPFQRKALMNNIVNYLMEKDIIEHFFININDYIEIWEEAIQINFAETLIRIFKRGSEEIIYKNMKNILCIVIRMCFKLISADEKNLSKEFIFALNEICNFLSSHKKIKVDNDIIDLVLNLGGYGKNVVSKRYCVYFCSCIIRINEPVHSGIVNRFMLLSSENESIIRNEISFHLRYFCFELDQAYIRKNIYKIVDSYLNDEDINCRFLTYETVIINLEKFTENSLFQCILNKVKNSLENKIVENYKHQLNLIIVIIEKCMNELSFGKNFIQLVKNFFKKNILIKESINFFPRQFIEKFDVLMSFFHNNNESQFINEIIIYLINYIYEGDGVNQRNLRQFFYENILVIYKPVCNPIISKHLKFKLFSIFDDCSQNKAIIPIFLQNLEGLFKYNADNEEFLTEYISNFKKIEEYLIKEKGWRTISIFIESHLNCESILYNEEIAQKLVIFVKTVTNENNYQIQKNGIKLLGKLLRHLSKTSREDIIKYMIDISNSKVFYTRRLFFPFFETIVEQYSFKFLSEYSLIEKIMKFLSDNNILSLICFFRLLPKFYYFISNDSKLKYQLEYKMEILKKDSKDRELQQILKKSFSFIAHFHDKFIYTNSFDDMVSNDKLKYEKELANFSREQISVQQSNSSSQITPLKKTMLENVDDIFRKRGKIYPLTKMRKSIIPVSKNDLIKILSNEKSKEPHRNNFKVKSYIEAKDTITVLKERNRKLSVEPSNKDKISHHFSPKSNYNFLPSVNQYNSNNSNCNNKKKV